MSRKSVTDGLGRLTQVFEDPAGLNYETDYAYDALGNLLSVNQKGSTNSALWRTRSFTYDSLNRITSALTTSTHASSPSHCWGETYNPDAWGNLQSIAATTNSNYTGCSEESGFSATPDGNNHLNIFSYDTSGNTQSDGVNSYTWNAESQLKSGGGVNYLYDGDGRRVAKVGSKLYWYGSGGDILAETDASGNTLNEYVFFGGKRIAILPASGTPIYYLEDMLGTSRVITTNTGTVCYDADFYPYGGERPYTNTCPQNYKFEGKERDTETSNDDFGARYYSNRFGRWLSADWSAVPVAVPYANLTNPQTLNLYAMVSDDPESFADLDGHLPLSSDNEGDATSSDPQRHKDDQPAQQQGKPTETQNHSTMQVEAVSSTVATDKKTGNPTITPGSIFQEKISVSDVKDGPVRLTVALQSPDGKPISGAEVLLSVREGSSPRIVPETGKEDHGPVGRTAVIGVVGKVSQDQQASLVFTMSKGKAVVASASQPVNLLQGSSSTSRKQMISAVGGSKDHVDFAVP